MVLLTIRYVHYIYYAAKKFLQAIINRKRELYDYYHSGLPVQWVQTTSFINTQVIMKEQD